MTVLGGFFMPRPIRKEDLFLVVDISRFVCLLAGSGYVPEGESNMTRRHQGSKHVPVRRVQ